MRPTDLSDEKPRPWYRATDALNALVWHSPLPQRAKALVSNIVYRNPPMPLERALVALASLEASGVRAVVMGGWGVDALAGRVLRTHRDLDLLTEGEQFDLAVRTMEGLGYKPWNRGGSGLSGNMRIRRVQTMRDPALRVVELHDVELDAADLGLGTGMLGGRPVECLSPEQQLRSQPQRARTFRQLRNKRVVAATMIAMTATALDVSGAATREAEASQERPASSRPGEGEGEGKGKGKGGG